MEPLRHLRLKAAVVLAFPLAFLASTVIASDIEMSLQVKSAKQRVSVKHTEEQPSPKKPPPRPVFASKSNETLLVSWTATNSGKKATFEDVVIHCVVVAEKEPGQAVLPSLKDTVQESALTMDFKPGDSATGQFSLVIDQPGTYLVWVETRNMFEKHNHEHYVALDLVCK
jgi:hypothetical protein